MCCRDSHRFLHSFDYQAIPAKKPLGTLANIARLKSNCICYTGIHCILKASKNDQDELDQDENFNVYSKLTFLKIPKPTIM